MEGEVLGLNLCGSILSRERKSLSGFLVFSQTNEARFPLGMCPLSPEHPQWINSSSFSSSCPALLRRTLALLGQKALEWVRRDLADGAQCDVMDCPVLPNGMQGCKQWPGCPSADSGMELFLWVCQPVLLIPWEFNCLEDFHALSFQFRWSWPKGSKVTFWWWKKGNCHGQSSHISLFARWNWS